MSEFNVFTIKQLKQIINATGISKFIKFSVPKPELIQQIEKYLDFDGYNFTIKETNQQQFLQSNLLKKDKPKISSKDKKILEMTKKEVQELKEIYKKNEEQIKKINLLTNSLKENIEEVQEIYPKKIIKKINIKKAKEDFNKLIEEPKKEKKIKEKKEIIDDFTKDFSSEKEFLNYLDYLAQTNYSSYQRTVKKLIDFHNRGIKLHLNVYNKLKY